MEATIHYKNGNKTTFQADSVETVNDVAYVDGILQTNVEDVEISA